MAKINDLIPDAQKHGHGVLQGTWHGIIATTPADEFAQVDVIIPDISTDHKWGPCYWTKRSGTFDLPHQGDQCVVVFDNRRAPWVVSWWSLIPTLVFPPGAFVAFGGVAAPTGWLLCDGSSYLRATYPALFAALGGAASTWGLPDGSHFNVPDLRGRVEVGYAAAGGHSDVSALANNEGSTLANRRPKHPHSHSLTLPNHGHTITDPQHYHGPGAGSVFVTSSNPGSSGGSGYTTGGSWRNVDTEAAATDSRSTGISVNNPTSNPAINGAVGASGVANDAPAYAVVNKIIKT